MLDAGRWLLDLVLSFTPHLTIVAAALFGLLVAQRHWGGSGILLLVVLTGAIVVLRSEHHLARAGGCDDAPTLRVTTFNVYRENKNPFALAALTASRSPDVLVVEELTDELSRQLSGVSDEYPYQLISEPPWVAILSRLPFEEAKVVDVPDAPAERSVLSIRLLHEGESIVLLGLHGVGPDTPGKFQVRGAQFDVVRELAASADGPVIVAGDFNATIFSRPFDALLDDAGLQTAVAGRREAPTWPDWARPLGVRIDHVLVSSGVDVCSVVLGPSSGSDHRPVTVDLRISASTEGS